MNTRLERFGQTNSELSRRWARQRVTAVQRYGDILASYGRGELTGRAAGEALGRLAAEEAACYPKEVVELGSDYVRALLGLVGITAGASAGHAHDRTPRRIEFEVRGPVGGQASRSFLLENKQDVTAEISFLVSAFAGPDAAAPFHAPIEFTPARLTLRPHEERTVEVQVLLDAALFHPGQRYRALIVVQGYNGLEIGLDVVAEAPVA
jgi:hypothetical protein